MKIHIRGKIHLRVQFLNTYRQTSGGHGAEIILAGLYRMVEVGGQRIQTAIVRCL